MRIRTRITSGYLVLILAMASVLLYQAYVIHRMQTINRNLSNINVRAASLPLSMKADLTQIEDTAQKLFLLEDPRYLESLHQFRVSFERWIAQIELLTISESERVEFNRLKDFWDRLFDVIRQVEDRVADPDAPFPADLAPSLTQILGIIRDQVDAFQRETQAAISSLSEESSRTGQTAEVISWSAALAALILSLLVGFLVVRSIHHRLRELTHATEVLSSGEFSHRLETKGDDELAQLARDFNRMSERLNELNELKNDFLSHVSHELKAPLASMQETTRLMLDGIPGRVNESQKKLLNLTLQSGKRLSTLIGNLLDLARMEAEALRYDFTEQDLAKLTASLLEEVNPRLAEKDLTLESDLPEEPVLVECDANRILQVISNLIENALKFSPKSETVTVRLRSLDGIPSTAPTEESGHGFRPGRSVASFSVVDRGPGIPPEERLSIFEKFHQVGLRHHSTAQGAGLGLTICRSIVRAHGGLIWVDPHPDGGSIFRVLLPI